MKIKQLKSQLTKAGFSRLPKRGKGSHSIWLHQRSRIKIIHSGRDASDAKFYQVKAVNSAIAQINNKSYLKS